MQLQGTRVLLNRPTAADFPNFWELINDADARKYTGGITQLNYDERRALYQQQCAAFGQDGNYEFSVYVAHKYIGYCGLLFDLAHDHFELLYGFASSYWGQGYASEAIQLVLDFAFTTLGLQSIIATVHPDNQASIHLLKKFGFTLQRTEDTYLLFALDAQ